MFKNEHELDYNLTKYTTFTEDITEDRIDFDIQIQIILYIKR